MVLRLNKKELAEFIQAMEENGSDTSQLKEFYSSLDKPKLKIEMVDWSEKHQAFWDKLQGLMQEQALQIHPRFQVRIRGWVDSAIRRNEKCVMFPGRDCPCQTPLDFGCPLLCKRDTEAPHLGRSESGSDDPDIEQKGPESNYS